MLIKVPAVKEETKKKLIKSLDSVFKNSRERAGLQAVVQEVLNDRNIFMWLVAFARYGQGIVLGKMSYWNEGLVVVPYGLVTSPVNLQKKQNYLHTNTKVRMLNFMKIFQVENTTVLNWKITHQQKNLPMK